MEEKFYNINNDLLVKFLLEETDADENLLVQNWLDESEDNRKFFEHFQIIWEQSKRLQSYMPVDENEAWERFRQRILPADRAKVIPIKAKRQWPLLRVAAVFILVSAFGWLSYYLSDVMSAKTLALNSQNNSIIDTLSDGSVVTLNKHSEISFPDKFRGETRSVKLKGEAFFNISPNKKKPFIIHVNDVTVTVVGTSFNIRSNGDSTEVIVETGVVEVSRDNKTVSLQPKEKVTVDKKDLSLEKLPVTDKLYSYYRSREFVCEATPLWKLVEVLNQAYDAKIVIGRKELRSLPLTTTFENQPLDSILAVISETFKISVEKSGDTIILK